MTKTVFKGEATQLEFAINGQTEAADVAKLKEAGYKVSFNTTLDKKTDGNITTSKDFKYNVVVTKDDDTFETGITDVKVIDGEAPAKINKVVIKQHNKEVNTVTADVNKKVTLEVKEYVNKAGKVVEKNIEDLKLKSKNLDLAVVSGDDILPVQAGKATIELSKDGMETYELVLNIAGEEREAATIDGLKDLGLSIDGKKQGEDVTLEPVVKDQFGDKMENAEVEIESSDKTIVSVEGKKIKAEKEGTATITVTVTGTDVKASFDVVVKEAGKIATYNLEIQEDKEAKLDASKDSDNKSFDVKFVGRDAEGLFVKELTGDGVTVKSSDDKVITYENGKVIAVDAGVAKIVATVTEGGLTLAKTELEVTVINTEKPAIENINLNEVIMEVAEDNIYTINYGAEDAVGNAKVKFTQPVKVSVVIDGTPISAEELAKIIGKTGANLYGFVEKIEADIGSTYEALGISGNFEVKVEIENKSEYKETFTFKFVEEIPAEEDAE